MDNPIERLTELFEHFPGIGPRQARRFVQYLLSQSNASRNEMADAIRSLGTTTNLCKKCYRWYVKSGRDVGLCAQCSNASRDRGLLFVLEKDADIDNVERGGYRGLYFVLGGTVPLAEEEPERFIRLRELTKRVEDDGKAGILKEVILGLSATTEGDHTHGILREILRTVAEEHHIAISSLGRGLSTGSELEYADPETIASALTSRKQEEESQ